ncbi:thioredoxin domain-containing protein [Streptomyces kronopolitis]|uniref:thioredoxin domain-containing protein n=1 Tax=Streptomyces kronopolitis TaxID=1612435 RepID=UPI003445E4CB
MSNRNTQSSKQAARTRLRAERERQKKKESVRRQLIAGGALVAVLAVAGAIGVAVATSGGESAGGDTWAKASSAELVRPAHTTGKNGTDLVIGKKDAGHTLTLFADPRCPFCATLDQNLNETIQKDVDNGKYKVSFRLGTFLDDGTRGTGSKNALSAMGAALDVGTDAFLSYKSALFSKEYHPEEAGPDKFADNEYLLKVADTVPALKGNAKFRDAVKSGTYRRWVLEVSKRFDSFKVPTPTVKLDGKVLGTDTPNGKAAPFSPDAFNAEVDKAVKAKL